jgi:hypothetical protein
MRLPLSDVLRFGAVRAAFASPWTLALPLLAAALCGATPSPKIMLIPNTFPANTAVVGVPYSSTYSCMLQSQQKVTNAVCYVLSLPAGLSVQSAPGCAPLVSLVVD